MTYQPHCFPDPTATLMSGNNLRDWQDERLSEARGILADAPHHPDARVILAARIVARLARDPNERAEAQGFLEIMDRSGPTGGAA